MKRLFVVLFLVSIFLMQGVWAAEEPVKAIGDRISGDTQKKWAVLEGNVKITQGSTVIYTAHAEIDMDRKLLYLKDGVKLVSADATITATTLDYDLRKKIGTFKGNVNLDRSEMKDKNGKVTKDAFKMQCDEMYFENNTKNFTGKGNGILGHKDFDGKANFIEYNDAKQEMVLKDNAYMKKKPDGEEITGDQIRLNLKDRSFIVENNVIIHMNVEEDDSKDKSDKKSK